MLCICSECETLSIQFKLGTMDIYIYVYQKKNSPSSSPSSSSSRR